MEAIGNAITKVKDGYLAAADWVAAHPHKTIWASLCLLIAALVF